MQYEAKDHTALSPSFTIMMDGSVKNNRNEAVAAIEDQAGLRKRVLVNTPEEVPVSKYDDEVVLKDLESNRKGSHRQQSENQRQQAPGDERVEIETFPQNTFSFLLMARYPICEKPQPEYEEGTNDLVPRHRSRDYLCIPFWSALIILTIQIAIYTLALFNATDLTNKKNPFNFPIDVDVSTRACEFAAVMITVYTEDNLFQGVDQFVESYKGLAETPGVTISKYYFSATTQVLVGLYGIFVTFIIIMQAEGVVDLLLDFTAMEFVAALDDAAFILAIRGFFGTPMKRTAKAVKNAKYAAEDVHTWLRKWTLLVIFAAVMTCFVLVWVNQSNRAFGENEIYVQFHDDVHPWLSTLSGVYTGCSLASSAISSITRGKSYSLGRTMYTTVPVADCQKNWKKSHGAFFYCDQKHWVFAVGENKTNPCDKWAMKSVKPQPGGSDEYDIMSHSSELWLAQDPTRTSGTGVVEEIQFLAGFEPSQNAGRNCSVLASTGNVFSYPFYAKLEDSVQQKSFLTERPVYFAGDDVDGEYIIYTGRRWVVVKASQIPECVHNCTASSESCCKLDPYASNYTVSFISDPLDLRRIEDTWIPSSDLIWYEAFSEYGNSSKPFNEKQSLVDQIDVIEALSSIGSFPTDEERQKLIALHLQSARLSCFCDSGNVECEKTVACGDDETTVWIDLQTDDRPQDTYFVVASNETWFDIEDEAVSGYNFASVRQNMLDGVNDRFASLNDTGYFDWQDAWNSSFAAKNNYQYTTCLPKNQCGFVYIEDLAGDGITFPGRFNVFLNTKQLQRDQGGRKCLYDLCKEKVTCSDTSLRSELFNPEGNCTDGSAPLAFQFFKDTSISLSNRSEWLLFDEATAAFEKNNVEYEHLEYNPLREIWNNVDLLVDTDDFNPDDILAPIRTTTCMPKSSCAIVDFDILDVPYEKVVSEDTGFPFEPPIVLYKGEQIGPGDGESGFDHCVYQFGDSCPTEVICSDREIRRPYTAPAIDCPLDQRPLAIQVKTDIYMEETSLIITDLETWMNGDLTGAATLNKTGTFVWGSTLRWGDLDDEADPESYLLNACVPDDVCGVVVLDDTFSDGIVGGGMTLVYDDEDILFGPQGDAFSTCVYQFGDCDAQLTCYNRTNPPPPYNPEIECQSGTTPLAFELQQDCCSAFEQTIHVTDVSWNQGSFPFPFLDTEGFFTWGSFEISNFENGPYHRFSTCVPSDICAVVAVNDNFGDGLEGGGFSVVYNNAEIIRAPVDVPFSSCKIQFGACETQIVCDNVES